MVSCRLMNAFPKKMRSETIELTVGVIKQSVAEDITNSLMGSSARRINNERN